MISVKEITEFGCEGPVVHKYIVLDSLGIELDLVTTLFDDESEIGIDWTLLNDDYFTRRAGLQKYSPEMPVWTPVDSFTRLVTYFVDSLVNTPDYSYYYQVRARDLCGNLVESERHRSILLKGGKEGEMDVKINWNRYIGWPEGVDRYEIWREVNKSREYLFYENVREDTSSFLSIGTDGYHQCFRIAAYRSGYPDFISWSNSVCFRYPPKVYIPNSFSPNNDGINDRFGVVSINISEFNMIIFNRWGEIVFQTNDPEGTWDGMYKGTMSETGVFGLVITYRGNSAESSYTGTITLLR
jgi:gliding motility-associated-like protein